jgi:hypothetical protein
MDRRSTSAKGFVHFGGEVRTGVEDGLGFSIGHASTGSTGWIETISDDTNAHLGIRAQGAGTITIGTSSNGVSLGGTLGVGGNSTFTGTVKIGTGATIKGAYSTTFAWTIAGLSSGHAGEITLTTAVSSLLNVGDLIGHISLTPAASTFDDLAILTIRQSDVGSSIVTIVVGNIASTTTDSTSGTGRITWFDLT